MRVEYNKLLRSKLQPLVVLFCDFNKIDYNKIDKKTRDRNVVQSRQMIYYYLKRYSTLSNANIGAVFNQDHATAIHGFKTIGNLIDTNIKFRSFNDDKEIYIKGFIKCMVNQVNYYIKQYEERKTELEILLYHGCI